ncbi:lipocalin family protein [Cohnella nanjingensis]|uniref:AttH domain-containing protein n=1 Tax=Cohnella nanjingensis TaxID=1387779 RepID=A0A7X0RRQ6_9BACL|nr:lipocalin family protein [Cohnella nanjingensis]MBB6671205.1 hypothetical protein [Cohnella nanjingensis]
MYRGPDLIALPEDAGSHPASNVEWWYAYAFLTGDRGNRYAAMASFFRVGELAFPKGHYLIHSLIQPDRGEFESQSELDRMLVGQMAGLYLPAYLFINPTDGHTWEQYKHVLTGSPPPPHRLLGPSAVHSDPTRVVYGDNHLLFQDDLDPRFQLQLTSGTARLRLNYTPTKPVALIDEAGDLNGLRYYSVTRNRVIGELYTAGRVETVRGEGWFDHQWGRSYGLLRRDGWDWFGLQLQDGNDLLVSRLRPGGGAPYSAAKLIRRDGTVVTSERVGLAPERSWRSPETGADYPIAWRIELPDFRMTLRVAPAMAHQEMRIAGPLRAIWEGACEVSGETRSPDGGIRPVTGRGFVELVGYPQMES